MVTNFCSHLTTLKLHQINHYFSTPKAFNFKKFYIKSRPYCFIPFKIRLENSLCNKSISFMHYLYTKYSKNMNKCTGKNMYYKFKEKISNVQK